jgi:hypothetical protein
VSETPARCPTCGTEIREGQTRCSACGRVFGDDNRCPSCNAVAGVFPFGAGYVCAACSAPRERLPGTVVLAGPTVLPVPMRRSTMPPAGAAAGAAPVRPSMASPLVSRGKGTAFRLGGIGAIGVGIAAATILAVFIPGVGGLVAAAAMGGLWVAIGALSLRAGAKASAEAERTESTGMELSLLALAEKSDGDLTATEAARGLGVGISVADAALTRMADGNHVTVEVDPEGVVHYVFRELRKHEPTAPRVRVDASLAPREAVEEAVEVEAREREEKSEEQAP